MTVRRVLYWVCLAGCLLFFFVYQQWFAFLLLLTLLVLPWLSFALSYPAMHNARVTLRCPAVTRIGIPAKVSMDLQCPYPTPPIRCGIRVVNDLTGESYLGKPGELLPTEHCGRVTATLQDAWVYDYLGLFRRKLPNGRCVSYVLPKPVATDLPPVGLRNNSILRPKPGGGFAEHYELRLYRPGDPLRNIHWKATAKTGKMIYREAMEQAKSGYSLTLLLSGTPRELDKKLGQLLWSSRSLLNQKQPHRIRCVSGKGLSVYTIHNERTLEACLHKLVALPQAGKDAVVPDAEAFWQQTIGGEDHEA